MHVLQQKAYLCLLLPLLWGAAASVQARAPPASRQLPPPWTLQAMKQSLSICEGSRDTHLGHMAVGLATFAQGICSTCTLAGQQIYYLLLPPNRCLASATCACMMRTRHMWGSGGVTPSSLTAEAFAAATCCACCEATSGIFCLASSPLHSTEDRGRLPMHPHSCPCPRLANPPA